MPKFQGFPSRADKNGVQEAGSSNLLTQTDPEALKLKASGFFIASKETYKSDHIDKFIAIFTYL